VKETLEAINQMRADGVIGKYAIGGAVGATFYLEPAATVDVDIFVNLPTAAGGSLLPIYDYLKSRGGRVRDEYIVVGDWPVQFLPLGNDLERDAVEKAVSTSVEGVDTWVMSAEHLVAIALQTGRTKDHARILQFVEQQAVDRRRLQDLLERHGLTARWHQFEQKYLGAIVSKPKLRARLNALSFSDKIKVLKKLRQRSEAIAASGLRQKSGKTAK
jgi:hypothetical protein